MFAILVVILAFVVVSFLPSCPSDGGVPGCGSHRTDVVMDMSYSWLKVLTVANVT